MYTFISKVGRKVCVMFKRNMSTAVLCYLVMMCGLVLAGCGKKPGTQMFTYVKKDDATIEITGFTDAAKEQSSLSYQRKLMVLKLHQLQENRSGIVQILKRFRLLKVLKR